jgi:hypothetical protein
MSTHINDGWYDAKAKTWTWKQAKSGNWMLEIWFELSEHGAVLGDLPCWLVFTDNTLEKRMEQLLAMGYAPVTGDMGQEIGCDDAGRCFGGLDANSVRAVVKTEADQSGAMKTKVDNIVAQKPKGAAQSVDATALRAFGAQMRGAVMAAAQRAKAGGVAQAQPRTNGAPQQRPAPTPTRGPGAQPRTVAPAEEVPDFGDADACPF